MVGMKHKNRSVPCFSYQLVNTHPSSYLCNKASLPLGNTFAQSHAQKTTAVTRLVGVFAGVGFAVGQFIAGAGANLLVAQTGSGLQRQAGRKNTIGQHSGGNGWKPAHHAITLARATWRYLALGRRTRNPAPLVEVTRSTGHGWP